MEYHFNLPSLFLSVSRHNRNNLALSYSDKNYSYEQLDFDSNKMAAILLDDGLKKGDVLAVINAKEYFSYALMIACLKIGVIYTNIDPDIPSERFKYTIETCKPSRIFADKPCSDQLMAASQTLGHRIELMSSMMEADTKFDSDQLAALSKSIDGDTLAYIMFTSGSTGRPKGVAISHQNIIHFIDWARSHYQVTTADRIANVNPMYFDNSVFDFYASIFSGACLLPVNKAIVASAKFLVDYLDSMKCSILFSVPSLFIYLMTMRVLNENSFAHIRVITFGGEGYPKGELKKLYDLFSHRVRFVNVYGPTECTCICSSYDISDEDFEDINGLPSLGRINPNFSFLIQEDGELCLLGPNVGRGYYNNAEATAKSFCEYTGFGYYHHRMYRTGDIVKQVDGLLFFVGRKDNQIKHMGYRIELEEIELAISLIPEVNQAAVIYQKQTTTHGKILAYVASDNNIDSKYIREQISASLPAYMIPNSVVVLQHLPKNQNGKIDKSALLAYST